MVTQWSSEHGEAMRANVNQKDMKLSLERMVSPTGVDKELYNAHINNLNQVVPSDNDYAIYQQYESGIASLKHYTTFCQSANVVVHLELFHGRMALEKLSAPWFPMYENLSAVTAPMAQDLTKRQLNQLVMV